MDAHFSEYVAVVESMQAIYGERSAGLTSDFHADPARGFADSSDTGALNPTTLAHEYLGV